MMRLESVAVPSLPPASLRWVLGGAASALVVGAAVSVNVALGFGLAILIAIGIAVAMRPVNILGILIAAVFLELFKIGGVAVTRLVAPIALIVVLFAITRRETAIRWSAPLGWVLGYSLWCLASGLWTLSVSGTTYALASLSIAVVYMLAFGSLITKKEELRRVLYMFAVFSLALGVLSILAFTGRHPLGLALSGEGRSGGGTGNPNFFAAIQVITLPMIIVLAAHERRRWGLAFLLVAGLINIGSVISTVSRGGTMSLVLVVLLILFLPANTLFRVRWQKVAAVTAIALGIAVFLLRYGGDVTPRLTSTFGGSQQTDAGSGRLAIWPVAWNEFKDHPVNGIGFGAFVEISIDRILGSPGSQDYELFKIEPKEVHNAYLGTLTELGIIGFFLFMGILVSTALALRRTARRARAVGEHFVANVANALIVSLAGWALGSIFAESETSRPRWIVIGICLALPKLLPEVAPVAAEDDAPEPEPSWSTLRRGGPATDPAPS
jgi:O-antigen ligase